MSPRLGESLKETRRLTENEIQKALERQRLRGGRLGDNLIALGFITEDDLESVFKRTPPAPKTAEETGLGLPFIADLIMKHVGGMGEFTLMEVSERVKLPVSVVDKAVEVLRGENMLEVKGAGQLSRLSYKFALTDKGMRRIADLLKISQYAGPAPVTFDEYRTMVEIQTVKSILVSEESVREAFSHLVLDKAFLGRIGPAVSSGRALFLYGPSGNGKTTIAEAIGRMLPGTIYVPYAIRVSGEIITVYDKVTHQAVEPEVSGDAIDQRWVLVKRPVVMVGGELTLKTLDLEFNPIAKFYEAPLQMKANNGLFIVDDFGRQLMDPQLLLNRWIVPLERRTDFLALQTGMKFEIPFDQLVIFSTNLEPRKLVDEAFLRRIHYKIKIDYPSVKEYEEIFRSVCEWNGIAFKRQSFDHLIKHYYTRLKVPLNACHPRDLIDHIIDSAHYHKHPPDVTEQSLKEAWESYFVEL